MPVYVQLNVGASHDFDLTDAGMLTVRFAAAASARGAPQWGAGRGFFAGMSKTF